MNLAAPPARTPRRRGPRGQPTAKALPGVHPGASCTATAVLRREHLGRGFYALYAHFQPGSIQVEPGDKVQRGDVIGLVGNSGNSSAPHLHFHVMSGPSPLASNGLPYVVGEFTITGQVPSTEAFDEAEASGEPLEVEPVDPPTSHRGEMPLDRSIVTFD